MYQEKIYVYISGADHFIFFRWYGQLVQWSLGATFIQWLFSRLNASMYCRQMINRQLKQCKTNHNITMQWSKKYKGKPDIIGYNKRAIIQSQIFITVALLNFWALYFLFKKVNLEYINSRLNSTSRQSVGRYATWFNNSMTNIVTSLFVCLFVCLSTWFTHLAFLQLPCHAVS